MTSNILDLFATAIRLFATASDVRRRFFDYGMALLFLALGGAFLIASAGFLIWALYDGLSIVMASANSARLILSILSMGVAGILIWVAKKTID